MRRTIRPKSYSQMPAAELDAITAKFQEEFVADQSRPLSAQLKALERRSKGSRGRPKIGQGAEKIRISVERGLLKRADLLARREGISRSELIAWSLRAALAVVG